MDRTFSRTFILWCLHSPLPRHQASKLLSVQVLPSKASHKINDTSMALQVLFKVSSGVICHTKRSTRAITGKDRHCVGKCSVLRLNFKPIVSLIQGVAECPSLFCIFITLQVSNNNITKFTRRRSCGKFKHFRPTVTPIFRNMGLLDFIVTVFAVRNKTNCCYNA